MQVPICTFAKVGVKHPKMRCTVAALSIVELAGSKADDEAVVVYGANATNFSMLCHRIYYLSYGYPLIELSA